MMGCGVMWYGVEKTGVVSTLDMLLTPSSFLLPPPGAALKLLRWRKPAEERYSFGINSRLTGTPCGVQHVFRQLSRERRVL